MTRKWHFVAFVMAKKCLCFDMDRGWRYVVLARLGRAFSCTDVVLVSVVRQNEVLQ